MILFEKKVGKLISLDSLCYGGEQDYRDFLKNGFNILTDLFKKIEGYFVCFFIIMDKTEVFLGVYGTTYITDINTYNGFMVPTLGIEPRAY